MAMGAEKKTRLDKYVAQALEIPRSASREMIAKGRVTVNVLSAGVVDFKALQKGGHPAGAGGGCVRRWPAAAP